MNNPLAHYTFGRSIGSPGRQLFIGAILNRYFLVLLPWRGIGKTLPTNHLNLAGVALQRFCDSRDVFLMLHSTGGINAGPISWLAGWLIHGRLGTGF